MEKKKQRENVCVCVCEGSGKKFEETFGKRGPEKSSSGQKFERTFGCVCVGRMF